MTKEGKQRHREINPEIDPIKFEEALAIVGSVGSTVGMPARQELRDVLAHLLMKVSEGVSNRELRDVIVSRINRLNAEAAHQSYDSSSEDDSKTRNAWKLEKLQRNLERLVGLPIEELQTIFNIPSDSDTGTWRKTIGGGKENIFGVDVDELRLRFLESEMIGLFRSQEQLQRELHEYLAVIGKLPDLSCVKLPRFLNMQIYLSEADPEQSRLVSEAFSRFLYGMGFDVADEFEPEGGSWFKRFIVKTREATSGPELEEALQKVQRALEIQGLTKPQGEVDKSAAEAAAIVLKAVEDIPEVACIFDRLVLLKQTAGNPGPRVIIRTLTTRQMLELQQNPDLRDPASILTIISDAGTVNAGAIDVLPERPNGTDET